MKPNNPFLVSGYHSPEFFCDREVETSKMIDALTNNRNITLIAPRRIGKTGLIQHVFYKLKENKSEIVPLYMDIYSTQNLGDFVRLFANTVLGQLDSTPQKVISRITKFVKSCRPVFTIDEITGSPKVSVDVTSSNEEITLKEIFEYLYSAEKQCYIAIDEFQQITEYPEKGIEALLRSYIQFAPNVNFIFAGSKQHVMEEMFISSKKPFYQSTQVLTLEAIDYDKYAEFSINHFNKNNADFPLEIFSEIYYKFEGHTWYIQNLLNRLYGYMKNVDNKLVDYAIDQIISEYNYIYANLLNAYPAGSIRLLKAIAKEGKINEILSGEFISKYNLRAASSVNSALKKLINNELVYHTPDGYIIYDRFMGEWLRRQQF